MNTTTKTEAQMRSADAAAAKADDLSLRLNNITEIVKLAAFAAEARRTLRGIQNVMHFKPQMQKDIGDGVRNSNNWLEMEDTSGEVLRYMAKQLDEINDEMTGTVHELVRANEGSTEANKNGGAT